jgi:hypothetical protein
MIDAKTITADRLAGFITADLIAYRREMVAQKDDDASEDIEDIDGAIEHARKASTHADALNALGMIYDRECAIMSIAEVLNVPSPHDDETIGRAIEVYFGTIDDPTEPINRAMLAWNYTLGNFDS